MSSPSNPSTTKAGHVRLLKKCLRSTNWDLSWKEELIELSADTRSPHWEATALMGTRWGPVLGPNQKWPKTGLPGGVIVDTYYEI